MNHVLLAWGWLGVSFFAASTAAAQDAEIHVHLFVLAEFPLLVEVDSADIPYPTPIPFEYKRLTRWTLDKWRDRSPEHFDLLAVVESYDTQPINAIELVLTRARKIGEFFDYDQLHLDPPHSSERAVWEVPVQIETKIVDSLDGRMATYVWFDSLSADDLWKDLSPQRRWPWETRYEITLQCSRCSPVTASASFTMSHPN